MNKFIRKQIKKQEKNRQAKTWELNKTKKQTNKNLRDEPFFKILKSGKQRLETKQNSGNQPNNTTNVRTNKNKKADEQKPEKTK